jgi:hypothetical protein
MITSELSTHIDTAVTRDIESIASVGLINQESKAALSTAVIDHQRMSATSTPITKRHFSVIDTISNAAAPSPIAAARDCLSDIGDAWKIIKASYHAYREIYFDVKLRRAKLKLAEKAIAECVDSDMRDVLEAERMIAVSQIERIESELAAGEGDLKEVISTLEQSSARYGQLLASSGRVEFTAAEFQQEEFDHLLKSAFWCAAKSFKIVAAKMDDPRDPPHLHIVLQQEIVAYFEGLGLTQPVIDKELMALAKTKQAFDFNNRDRGISFKGHLNSWLDGMVVKYRQHIQTQVDQYGIARLQRIAKIVNPQVTDAGQAAGDTDVERTSVFQR